MKGAIPFFGMVGTSALLRWTERLGQPLVVGDPVRVRTRRSPLAGESGQVTEVSPADPYGPYLVQFNSGLRFRYCRNELALTYTIDSAVKNR